ncbi:MAG: hypothetical protein IPP41_09650 [Rhodocyclaceae bacterium]|nr:hypothetical protein [Rhodocyclaceae bacterium]
MKPDSEASIAIFRIAQEALTNIAKHAQATQVNMRLSRFGGNIVLDIHDNGKGISDDDLSKPKSFGLRGIRERVLGLAGEFSIVAADTGGTKFACGSKHISAESERQDEQHREQQRETQRKLF